MFLSRPMKMKRRAGKGNEARKGKGTTSVVPISVANVFALQHLR
jgi:hypothetical protein